MSLSTKALAPAAQRLVDVLVRIEGGQDQHPHIPVGLLKDPGGRFEAVHLGHADVHEDHVRAMTAYGLDRLDAGPRLGHDLDVVVDPENHGEAAAYQRLVVGDDDADAHVGSPLVGSRAVSRKPPPGRGWASRLPPSRRARSRMPTMPWPGTPLVGGRHRLDGGTAAVVEDLDGDAVTFGAQAHLGAGLRSAVLEHVGQCLLDDAVRRELHAGRERIRGCRR
jgi:hypothetical protein